MYIRQNLWNITISPTEMRRPLIKTLAQKRGDTSESLNLAFKHQLSLALR